MTKLESTFRELMTIQVVSVLFTHVNRKGRVASLFNDNQSMFWYSHTGQTNLASALDQLPVWDMLGHVEKSVPKKTKFLDSDFNTFLAVDVFGIWYLVSICRK